MNCTKKALLFAACLCTVGCSEPGPNVENIQQALTQYMQSSNNGQLFRLAEISVSETKMVNNDTYQLKIQYQLEAKQDLQTVVKENLANKLENDFDLLMATSAYKMHFKDFNEGELISKVDSMQLVRDGEYWRVNR